MIGEIYGLFFVLIILVVVFVLAVAGLIIDTVHPSVVHILATAPKIGHTLYFSPAMRAIGVGAETYFVKMVGSTGPYGQGAYEPVSVVVFD
jgi:hypothetical protein